MEDSQAWVAWEVNPKAKAEARKVSSNFSEEICPETSLSNSRKVRLDPIKTFLKDSDFSLLIGKTISVTTHVFI